MTRGRRKAPQAKRRFFPEDAKLQKKAIRARFRKSMPLEQDLLVLEEEKKKTPKKKSSLKKAIQKPSPKKVEKKKNKAPGRKPKSKKRFRGIVDRKNGTWIAQKSINGKLKTLGTFKSQEDAARKFDEATFAQKGRAYKFYNFPDELDRFEKKKKE